MEEVKNLIQILNKKDSQEPDKPVKGTGLVIYGGGKEKTPTGQDNSFRNSGITLDSLQSFAKNYNLPTTSNKDLQDAMVKLLSSTEAGKKSLEEIDKKYGKTKAGTLSDNILGARTVDMMQSLNANKAAEDEKTRLSGLVKRVASTQEGKFYSFKDAQSFGNYINRGLLDGAQEISGDDITKIKALFPNRFK